MAREWVIHEYSGYEGLTLQEYDEDQPGEGEIRLRVEAFALNWGDMNLMHNQYSFSFESFPARVGIEAAGIVDAVGPGVSGIEQGERYCTLPYFYYNRGASGDSMIIDSRYVTKAPQGLSAIQSASIWMQYLTAYYPIIELARAAPGVAILVPAGTSTAGSAALEFGRMHGATMIATTRFDYNTDYLKDKGATHVIVPDDVDLADELMKMTDGKGVDAVFDPIGAGMINRYSPALARDSQIFFYGMLDAQFPDMPIVDLFRSNCVFRAYSMYNYVENEAMQKKGTDFVHQAIADGKIAAQVDRVYPMEEYREAWDYLSAPRKTHGKVMIETGN